MIKDRVWGRVRKILKRVREEDEDNGDFWTDRILKMKEIAIVDREAELPEMMQLSEFKNCLLYIPLHIRLAIKEAGWRKVIDA